MPPSQKSPVPRYANVTPHGMQLGSSLVHGCCPVAFGVGAFVMVADPGGSAPTYANHCQAIPTYANHPHPLLFWQLAIAFVTQQAGAYRAVASRRRVALRTGGRDAVTTF
jgi:hypothetical protein